MKRFILGSCCLLTLAATESVASAAIMFSSGLDDLTGLSVVGTADSAHTVNYNYAADGIPEAPNYVGGAAQRGLKLEANLVAPTGSEEIATIFAIPVSGRYTVQADIWVNANGPFPGGGAGSTEFAGLAVGHDGATAGRNGASLIYDGEGGSSRDYRLYKNSGEQDIASGQYAVDSANNSGADFSAAFPGLSAPASQGQTGTTNDGAGGFQWMTMLVEVDSNAIGSGITADAGTAKFTLTSAASGNTLVVGTIDNSNGGDVVNMAGQAALVYSDIFSSVSDNAGFSFGLFDNFIVETTVIPEPSTLLLLSLGGLTAFVRRR